MLCLACFVIPFVDEVKVLKKGVGRLLSHSPLGVLGAIQLRALAFV